jgi:uncharacterized protein with von Willebrand factor type A (vWA) domain
MDFRFSRFTPDVPASDFERLMEIFTELLNYTAGNASEALSWLTELDREHKLTNSDYAMGDFLRDLKEKGYLKENESGDPVITPKTEQHIRKQSLEQIFGKLKKTKSGRHKTNKNGTGDEWSDGNRPWQFGDGTDQLDLTGSIRNAQVHHGIEEFNLSEVDLEVHEKEHKSNHATVLMIDISHSMILYGEDRITPAKKTAMALAELIHTKYPKDHLDILVFGDDAWPITVKDLPYLQVGPYHTNTSAGLELALELLRKRKTSNKQIFMITDGKPTCLKMGNNYYRNSFGLDRKITNHVFNLAAQCRRLNIPVTTFMIAQDSYLQNFVREFTRINNGRAFYSSLNQLGEFIYEDYLRNRKKNVR